MISAYSVEDVRTAEGRAMAAVPEGFLMQRAASALAVVVAELVPAGVYGARVVLLVGPGSNGGDALWAGARLARRGARVDALLITETVHAEGLAALTRAGGRAHEVGGWGRSVAEVARGGRGRRGRDPRDRGAAGLPALAVRVLDAVPDEAVVVAVDLPERRRPGDGRAAGWGR